MQKQLDALYFNLPPTNPARRFHILERVHQIANQINNAHPNKIQ